jgi:hypothetical protein
VATGRRIAHGGIPFHLEKNMENEEKTERHFRRSESIAALAGALATAQGLITGATKDSANPFFKSRYADLASCWEACRGPLAANAIAVIQFPRFMDTEDWTEHVPMNADDKDSPTVPMRRVRGNVQVETMLCHSSGEWVAEVLEVPVLKADAQTIGSATTYARRYGLCAIVGIAPEDDDGNAAAGTQSNGNAVQKLNQKPRPDLFRLKTLDFLKLAASNGTLALQEAWKTKISPEARKVCKDDLDLLKAEAARIDTEKAEEALATSPDAASAAREPGEEG